MSTATEIDSLDGVLRSCFGRTAGIYTDVIGCLNNAGVDFILINLPLHYDMKKQPTDLDLLCDDENYERAGRYLGSHGWLRLSRRPAPDQIVFVGFHPGCGFARVHLHKHLGFYGVKWIDYGQAVDRTIQLDGIRVADRVLDYHTLVVEWFFKNKTDYPRRICELLAGERIDTLESEGKRILASHYKQFRTIEDLIRENNASSPVRRLTLALRSLSDWSRVIRFMGGRLYQRFDFVQLWRRTGTFLVVMGIDGSGKTTLAREIIRQHNEGGLFACYRYFGLKTTLVQRLRRLLKPREDERERYAGQKGIADHLSRKSSLAANLLNLMLSMVYMAEYFVRSVMAMQSVRRYNDLVVMDRTWLDKLATPHRWGDKLLYYVLPKPDIVVALSGDLKVFHERTHEFEIPVLKRMQRSLNDAVDFLEKKGVTIVRIDSVRNDIERCAGLAQEKLWDHVRG